jgi:hypothetical protein
MSHIPKALYKQLEGPDRVPGARGHSGTYSQGAFKGYIYIKITAYAHSL